VLVRGLASLAVLAGASRAVRGSFTLAVRQCGETSRVIRRQLSHLFQELEISVVAPYLVRKAFRVVTSP